MNSSECAELVKWLQAQPVLYFDEALNFLLVHAGIHPLWDLSQAIANAMELESILQSKEDRKVFQNYVWESTKYMDFRSFRAR
eukprot:UN02980